MVVLRTSAFRGPPRRAERIIECACFLIFLSLCSHCRRCNTAYELIFQGWPWMGFGTVWIGRSSSAASGFFWEEVLWTWVQHVCLDCCLQKSLFRKSTCVHFASSGSVMLILCSRNLIGPLPSLERLCKCNEMNMTIHSIYTRFFDKGRQEPFALLKNKC
jgi:hypothetical protein